MALGTLRDLAMDAVTGGAIKGGMLALVIPQLSDLWRMASGTSVRNIARK